MKIRTEKKESRSGWAKTPHFVWRVKSHTGGAVFEIPRLVPSTSTMVQIIVQPPSEPAKTLWLVSSNPSDNASVPESEEREHFP